MKNIILCTLTLVSSVFSMTSYCIDSSNPSIYESEDGVKAFILTYESDPNAYLVKMTGTKTILDNTVIEVGKIEGNGEVDTLNTLLYGGIAKLFNLYNESFV